MECEKSIPNNSIKRHKQKPGFERTMTISERVMLPSKWPIAGKSYRSICYRNSNSQVPVYILVG